MVDVSMMDGSLAMMFFPFATYFAQGRQPKRGFEGLTGRYACYHLYQTKDDRYLALGALEPKFWINACHVLKREDLIELQFNNDRQHFVIDTLQRIFLTKTASQWLAEFSGKDACLTLVKDIDEMLDDPQVRHRQLIAEIDHPQGGKLTQIAPLLKFSATCAELRLPPPLLGQHSNEILKEAGYNDEMIVLLKNSGVIEQSGSDGC